METAERNSPAHSALTELDRRALWTMRENRFNLAFGALMRRLGSAAIRAKRVHSPKRR